MGTNPAQIVDSLRRGLSQLEAERDAELERVRSVYEGRIDSLHTAIQALEGDEAQTTSLSPLDQRPNVTLLSVGEEKLDKVRKDLLKHPRSRQADIVKRTKLNSGTVSVALRRLQLDSGDGFQLAQVGVADSSRLWELVQVPSSVAANRSS